MEAAPSSTSAWRQPCRTGASEELWFCSSTGCWVLKAWKAIALCWAESSGGMVGSSERKKKSSRNKRSSSSKLTLWLSMARHFCVEPQIKSFLLLHCENMGKDQVVSFSQDSLIIDILAASLFLLFCTFIIIPSTCSLRDKSLSASELLVWRSFVGTEMNANMKYLISSHERGAENNLLWREVAGGRIWDQEFMTHPLHSPPMPSLLFHLTLSSSSWAVNPSHRAPPTPAGTWGSSRSAWKWRVIPGTKWSTSHCNPPKSLPLSSLPHLFVSLCSWRHQTKP